MPASTSINPIGIIRSCYPEKFGVPRQPGLVRAAAAEIEMLPPYNDPAAFEGLAEFSHIWIIFEFHLNQRDNWKPKVRPPRLGGNESLGVFATRSPFRPNRLGLSAVKLADIRFDGPKTRLIIEGADLVDGTPVIDIKPYIAYTDAIDADSAFASEAPSARLPVHYTGEAEARLAMLSDQYPDLRLLITETLALDPRPQYHGKKNSPQKTRSYGVRIYDLDIRWKVSDGVIEVTDIISV